MSVYRFVYPVCEAALAALNGILETDQFGRLSYSDGAIPDPASRRALANAIRAYWKETHAMPMAELWYRILLDDSASAVGGLTNRPGRPTISFSRMSSQERPIPPPGTGPLKGESLRVGRDPSVTALMLRRARQLEPKQLGQPGATSPTSKPLATWLRAWQSGNQS